MILYSYTEITLINAEISFGMGFCYIHAEGRCLFINICTNYGLKYNWRTTLQLYLIVDIEFYL